ncbi:MAG: DEAD/DEAH box helicase [Gammaproteobacteria bacterium]
MSADPVLASNFNDFGLPAAIVQALADVGYETPTAIQAETIPVLQAGRDLIGQAQTGTGKTAAFALPILQGISLGQAGPQALILAPTRELAIQVAEAFQRYASHMKGFHVLPIYGGQDYGVQLRALKRGVHIVVGTPGRVMDHMRRATLRLDSLKYVVLDEADEMLRMGFIDDIEWILEQTPPARQTALFSATMPTPIRKIAERYLRDPAQISIRMQTTTAATIRQRYCTVSGGHKLDALTRILEGENIEGVLIFVRTRIATEELAGRLTARGFACAAINGDLPQKMRERTIENLKQGTLDILVATDVAARGLDVERVSHVINFDIPYDPEVYVHRIGRTGRAGRHGDAILFVAPREQRMLKLIERATNQPIERMEVPSAEIINDKRLARFMQSISDTLDAGDLEIYVDLVTRYQRDHDGDPLLIAAALAKLVQGDEPLLMAPGPREREPRRSEHARGWGARDEPQPRERRPREREPLHYESTGDHGPRPPAGWHERPAAGDAITDPRVPADGEQPPRRGAQREPFPRAEHRAAPSYGADPGQRDDARGELHLRQHRAPAGMETYRLEVGHEHGVKPGNIVGAIAGETGLDAREIGRININGDHSTVDLPSGMPKEIFQVLKKVWVSGQQLRISRLDEARGGPSRPRDRAPGGPPRFKDRHRDRKNKGAPKRRGRD